MEWKSPRIPCYFGSKIYCGTQSPKSPTCWHLHPVQCFPHDTKISLYKQWFPADMMACHSPNYSIEDWDFHLGLISSRTLSKSLFLSPSFPSALLPSLSLPFSFRSLPRAGQLSCHEDIQETHEEANRGKHSNQKGRSKTVFAGDMILYIENPKDSNENCKN